MTSALEGGGWSAPRPGRFPPHPPPPPGMTCYPLYRRLGGPQGRSGHVWKISPSPGFDPRTVQPVAQSLYRLSYPVPWKRYYVSRNKGICLPTERNSYSVLHKNKNPPISYNAYSVTFTKIQIWGPIRKQPGVFWYSFQRKMPPSFLPWKWKQRAHS
jgi:hypothetical protein